MYETLAEQALRIRTQIAKLEGAMSSGILTVEGADGTGRVTYRSYAEMRLALNDLNRKLAGIVAKDEGGTAPRRTRQIVMTGRSGW